MSKVIVGLLVTVGLLLSPLVVAGAELKIGVVDTDDILSKSSESKKVQDTLKRKAEDLGKPFQQKRADLARQMEEFQKQASVMKEDARKRRAEELEKKISELDRQGQEAQKQLAQLEEKELAPILKKLENAILAVGKDEKLDLVLQKRTVVLINNTLDITDKVRSKFGP